MLGRIVLMRAAGAVPARGRARGFMSGLGQRMQGWTERKQDEMQLKQFGDQIKAMSETETFTMQAFHDTVAKQARQAGAIGWRSLIPGAGKGAGVKEAEDVLRILDVMTAEEKAAGHELGKDDKLRIAAASGRDVADVNLMLRKFAMLESMHAWIRNEARLGNPLPESQAELHAAAVRRPLQKPSGAVLRKRRR